MIRIPILRSLPPCRCGHLGTVTERSSADTSNALLQRVTNYQVLHFAVICEWRDCDSRKALQWHGTREAARQAWTERNGAPE